MAEIIVKIRPALTALKIGESVTFPISKLKSVRTQASELGPFITGSTRPKPTGRT